MSTGPAYHLADPRFTRLHQVRALCVSRRSNALWGMQMTRDAQQVTCKRCLAKMPKPVSA